MPLTDFLTEYREAIEDEKERQKNAPKTPKYRPKKPKRHK